MLRWTRRWHLHLMALTVALGVLFLAVRELGEHALYALPGAAGPEVFLGVVIVLLAIVLGISLGLRPWWAPGALRHGLAGSQSRGRVMVCADSLLGAGIYELLAREGTLDVGRIDPADESALLRALTRARPDALVLDQATPLTEPARLLTLLADYPQLRIAVVSADQDSVQVFDRTRVEVAALSDLVNLLHLEHEPSNQEREVQENS